MQTKCHLEVLVLFVDLGVSTICGQFGERSLKCCYEVEETMMQVWSSCN